MSDYYSVISNAVDSLGPSNPDQRRALYDRARRALVERLRAAKPPISEESINAERTLLEIAIRRVETAVGGRRAPALAPAPGATKEVPAETPRKAPAPPPTPRAEAAPREPDGDPVEQPPATRRGKRGLLYVLGAVAAAAAIALVATLAYKQVPEQRVAQQTAQLHDQQTPRQQQVSTPDPVNYVYLQQIVYYRTTHPAGTIIVDKAQNFLYLVRSNVAAMRYGIGNGPECAKAAGLYHILRKEIEAAIPAEPGVQTASLPGGPGAFPHGHVVRFGNEYRIHRLTEPNRVGQVASTGCFQLTDKDIAGLYERVAVAARVVVLN